MNKRVGLYLLSLVIGPLACGSSGQTNGTFGNTIDYGGDGDDQGDGHADDNGDGDDQGDGHADDNGDGDGDDQGDPRVKFDLSTLPDASKLEGCNAIDFLFVIDNSGSMDDQQTQLLNSFPGFIQAIEDSLKTVDSIHLGVVTSDAYVHNEPGCTILGGLVTRTQFQPCAPFAEGKRFVTDADDIANEFSCMAAVGSAGSAFEMPISALVQAISPALNANNACNDGFLRENAVLVVVVITDDPPWQSTFDDAHPDWDTSGWHQALIDAKDGNEEALVVLGFVPYDDLSCIGETQESPNLISFINSFGEHGILTSVCEPDYGPIFDASIETINGACQDFAI